MTLSPKSSRSRVASPLEFSEKTAPKKTVGIRTDNPTIFKFDPSLPANSRVLKTTARTNVTLHKFIMEYDKGNRFDGSYGFWKTIGKIFADPQIINELDNLKPKDLQKIITIFQREFEEEVKLMIGFYDGIAEIEQKIAITEAKEGVLEQHLQDWSVAKIKSAQGEIARDKKDISDAIDMLDFALQEGLAGFENYLEIDVLKSQINSISRVENRLMKLQLRRAIQDDNLPLDTKELFQITLNYLEKATPEESAFTAVATGEQLEKNLLSVIFKVGRIMEIEENFRNVGMVKELYKMINHLENSLKQKQDQEKTKLDDEEFVELRKAIIEYAKRLEAQGKLTLKDSVKKEVKPAPQQPKISQSQKQSSNANPSLRTSPTQPERPSMIPKPQVFRSKTQASDATPTLRKPPTEPRLPLRSPTAKTTSAKTNSQAESQKKKPESLLQISVRNLALFNAVSKPDLTIEQRLKTINNPSSANINGRLKDGKTPLQLCIENPQIAIDDKIKVAKALIKQGAKVGVYNQGEELIGLANQQDQGLGELLENALNVERKLKPKTSPSCSKTKTEQLERSQRRTQMVR